MLIRIGIKPNCSNLQIGDIVGGQFYDSTNIPTQINWRIPLSYQFQKKGDSPKKPDKPDKPTKEPNDPTSTPGGTKTGTSSQSVPGGSAGAENYTG